MSGYTPVFGSLFQGSLCGQWPALPVFCTLLPLADKNGELDYSFAYLSVVTGWPEDLLREGIAALESPDPASRKADDDGRRLVRLRENTEWGWRIVNHAHYREKARKAMRQIEETASGRDAERKRIARERAELIDVRRCPAVSGADRLSDSDTDTDSGVRITGAAGGAPSPKPRTATRLPGDFGLTAEREEYAKANLPRVDAPALMESFRDHWSAASGAKARKLDWDATWRTWVRNANQFGYPMVTQSAANKPQIRIDANGRQISG